MAVTLVGRTLKMTAAGDAKTGKMGIRMIILDHSSAANCIIQNSATAELLGLRNTTSELSKVIYFDPPYMTDGLIAQTLSAGSLQFILA